MWDSPRLADKRPQHSAPVCEVSYAIVRPIASSSRGLTSARSAGRDLRLTNFPSLSCSRSMSLLQSSDEATPAYSATRLILSKSASNIFSITSVS